jgi:tetratricopeptide (TPR) repeat protein
MRVFMKTLLLYGWLLMCLLTLNACQTSGQTQAVNKQAGLASLTESQQALYQQALADLEQHKPQQAEVGLSGLLRERSDLAELWLNLALSQYQQKNWEKTATTTATLLTKFPNVAQGHNLAGLLAVEKGEFAKAQEHYVKSLQLDPNYINALYNMALLQDVYLQNIPSAVNYYSLYLGQVEDEETKAWMEHLSQTVAPRGE